jgi:hypothetical protein
MDEIAEGYVRLVLAIGVHEPDYVDAYYGPPAWRAEAEQEQAPLGALAARADALLDALGPTTPDAVDGSRHAYLRRQLLAARSRLAILGGARLGFDDESRALYDAVAPANDEAVFEEAAAELDGRLSGRGSVQERFASWRAAFVIPRARLDAVFSAAIAAGRDETRRHLTLPADECFSMEYVTDKPWSGYNWYQGGYRSVIQVNTDLPIYIDRAIDLACHEGYPGHPVYNVLLEERLVRGRGWVELSIYALFSPQSLVAVGTANYGIEMAFPGPARRDFERTTLYPIAGLDPARVDEYFDIQALLRRLGYAGNEAARRYLDGTIDRETAAAWLVRYALMTPAAALQRTRFFDRYRSYVITYNHGQDLVQRHIDRAVAGGLSRWKAFESLLTEPGTGL